MRTVPETAMRKISLDLDRLQVETFQTLRANAIKGTARAHEAVPWTQPLTCSCTQPMTSPICWCPNPTPITNVGATCPVPEC